MQKILLVISFKNFQDQEYLIPKELFEKNGFLTKTVSTKRGVAIGSFGLDVKIEELLEEVVVNNFDAVVFIGGGGCIEELDNETSYDVIKEAEKKNKVLGAICIAPLIFANAGILLNKRATIWSYNKIKKTPSLLKEKGVVYVEEKVVCAGNIITANGPSAAEEFAIKIIEKLKEKLDKKL